MSVFLLAVASSGVRLRLEWGLAHEGHDCLTAATGMMALVLACRTPPDCILMSSDLPDIEWTRLCNLLRMIPFTAHAPIIFLLQGNSPEHVQEALNVGAVDILQMPVQPETLLARTTRHLSETYVKGQNVIFSPSQSRVEIPGSIATWTPPFLQFDRPTGNGLDSYLRPGTTGEIFHFPDEFPGLRYCRAVQLLAPTGGSPGLVQAKVGSASYMHKRRSIPLAISGRPIRYRPTDGFYRLATLKGIDAFGFRMTGVHESISIGVEVELDLTIQATTLHVAGQVSWRGTVDKSEVGIELGPVHESARLALAVHMLQLQQERDEQAVKRISYLPKSIGSGQLVPLQQH